MTRLIGAISFSMAMLALADPLGAQPSPVPGGGQPGGVADRSGAVAPAQEEWIKALSERPPLVSLGEPPDYGDAGDKLPDLLKDRLRLLSKKIFSNRAWRAFWERQRDLGTELAGLYAQQAATAAGAEQTVADLKAKGLLRWAGLAAQKVDNQNTYMRALATERDAVEDRRNKVLDQQATAAAHVTPAVAGSREPTPYEEREQCLEELRERIDFQLDRQDIAAMELKLIERQTESIGLMDEALRKDVELANLELEIAAEQAKSPDRNWVAIWAPFATRAATKAAAIERELELGDQRRRGLEVEVELAQARIKYREGKKAELEAELAEAEGFDTLWPATWQTAIQFFKDRAWKLALVLLLIYIALRVALRLIRMGNDAILKAFKDDDDDHLTVAEKQAETIKTVFAPVMRVAAYAIAVLVALDQIGIDTGPLLGSVAILGLAISFGSQNLVRDLVNGFFILIENQFGVGDVVEIGGSTGTVENVNVRSTRLRQLDGTLRIIPNGEITNVANRTREWSRAVVHCGVGYDSDMARVAEVVNEIGQELYAEPEWAGKLLEAPSFVGVTELGDSAVVFRCMGKTQPGEHWGLERELNKRLHEVLGERGIEIPFPQRVVWNKG